MTDFWEDYLASAIETANSRNKADLIRIKDYYNMTNYQDLCTPLHIAARMGCVEAMEIFLDSGAASVYLKDRFNATPLHYAAKSGQINSIKFLIKRGATVGCLDVEIRTPLHYAVCHTENEDAVKLLIMIGAEINAVNQDQSTPLHLAAQKKNNLNIVMVLVNAGADVSIRNKFDFMPLNYAIKQQDVNMSKLLLRTYCSTNLDQISETVDEMLLFTVMHMNMKAIVSLLFRYGADVNAQDIINSTPLHIVIKEYTSSVYMEFLIRCGANLQAENSLLETPLSTAVRLNEDEDVDTLIKFGADVDSKNSLGDTALFVAVKTNNKKMIEKLIELGADIDAKNLLEETALLAALGGNKEVAFKTLLEHSADVEFENSHGKSAHSITRNNVFRNALMQHFIKLKVLNLLKQQSSRSKVFRLMYNVQFHSFMLNCKKEVKKMHNEIISPEHNLSLYNVFITSYFTKATKFWNDYNLNSLLSNIRCKENYPIYGAMIDNRFRKFANKVTLLDEHRKCLRCLFRHYSELPKLCLDVILNYLDETSLNMLKSSIN